jgi:dihydrofolate reductase
MWRACALSAARPLRQKKLLASPRGPHHGAMKLTTMTQVTVDGVMQGNGHASPEELASGFTRDGWALGAFADDTGEMITEAYQRADAFSFGRRTYEMFAETWGTRPEMRQHPIGVALNRVQKYVVSDSLDRPDWGPVDLLSGDPIAAISELKEASLGEMQVHGSATLIRALLVAGLIDEMTLLVVPVVLGQGKRLFPDDGPDAALEVIRSHTDARGVGVHVYRPAGTPEYYPARPD